MANGTVHAAGLLHVTAGRMLDPQADSVTTLHKIYAAGLGGAVLGTKQGTGKSIYEGPGFFATMKGLVGFYLVSSANYDDVLKTLHETWKPPTTSPSNMAIVPVLDLSDIPRAARGVRTLYVLKHAQVSRKALSKTVWPKLAAMQPAIVLVDEYATAMNKPDSVLSQCVQAIRGKSGFPVFIEARFKKYATNLADVRTIVAQLCGARDVNKLTIEQLAEYVVYHNEAKYDEHLPKKEIKPVDITFPVPLRTVQGEDYRRCVARRIIALMNEYRFTKIVVGGSTDGDSAYPSHADVKFFTGYFKSKGVGSLCVNSGRTVASTIDKFVRDGTLQVIFLSQGSIRGTDQLKGVQNMFWLGRKGIVDGRDGNVRVAVLEDQESALCRIRRLGSPRTDVRRYWTFMPRHVLTPQRGGSRSSSPVSASGGAGGGFAGGRSAGAGGAGAARQLSMTTPSTNGKRRASDAAESVSKRPSKECWKCSHVYWSDVAMCAKPDCGAKLATGLA